MTQGKKVYVYVDESGKQSGEAFIVAVVFVDGAGKERLEKALVRCERASGKGEWKWSKTPDVRRAAYMRQVAQQDELTPFYYQITEGSDDYLKRTAEAILAAIDVHKPLERSNITIVVDGLNQAEREAIKRLLRRPKLPHSLEVRGGRDESTPFIRLADAVAGFLRHVRQRRGSMERIWEDVKSLFVRV